MCPLGLREIAPTYHIALLDNPDHRMGFLCVAIGHANDVPLHADGR